MKHIHIGLEVADSGERVIRTGCTECCYHKSEKAWIIDLDANRWETFFSSGRLAEYGEDETEFSVAHEDGRAETAASQGKPAT